MKKILINASFHLVFALLGIGFGTLLVDNNVFDRIRFWIRPVVIMQGELVEEISLGMLRCISSERNSVVWNVNTKVLKHTEIE